MVTMIIILGVFALLIGLMPSELYAFQSDYEVPDQQDQEVVDYFNAHNITIYENSWNFYLTVGNVETNQSGLPEGESVEFHYREANNGNKFIQIRHAAFTFFDLIISFHVIEPVEPYRSEMGYTGYESETVGVIFPTIYNPVITKDNVLAIVEYDNSSYFEAACHHISQNFVILPYNSSFATLEESFEAGYIHVYSSYDIDFDAMKPSVWLLVAQLITFQNPDFGIPGDFGVVFNYCFAIGFWIVIAIIIYTLVTRVIPTIQGGIEN